MPDFLLAVFVVFVLLYLRSSHFEAMDDEEWRYQHRLAMKKYEAAFRYTDMRWDSYRATLYALRYAAKHRD